MKSAIGILFWSLFLASLPPSSSAETSAVDSGAAASADTKIQAGLMTLNFKNGDIREVLRAIGLARGANIVADRDVEGTVTVYLKDVTIETALEAVTAPNGLYWEFDGGLYRVKRIRENPFVRSRNGTVTIHADNIAIGIFLDAVAKATGLNLVTSEPLSVNLTAHLTEAPIEDGVIQAIRSNGLLVAKDGGIIRISPARAPVKAEKQSDGKIVLDAQGADIRAAFTALARLTDENIILDADISISNATFYVSQEDLAGVLDALTATYGFAWQKLGGLYRIYRPQSGVALPVALDENARVTFDLRGAELGDVVRQIAIKKGWNSILYADLKEKVNQRVDRLDIESVFDLLFENTPYAWILDTSTTPLPTLIVGNPSLGSREAEIFVRERSYPLKYVKTSVVMGLLPREVPSANVKVIAEQNLLMVTGTPKMHREMTELLDRLDTPQRQIVIEMLVVEVNNEKARTLGLQGLNYQQNEIIGTFSPAGSPTASLELTRGRILTQSLSTSFTTLEREGVVTVKARPNIMVKSGEAATFSVAREDNFALTAPSATPNVPTVTAQKIPSGITLNVTPWVGQDGVAVHMTISGEVSSSSGQISATQLPTVSARRANTQVLVNSGQTIVIGGLIQGRNNKADDSIPIIGKIPILKFFFGNSSVSTASTEVVFYITPKIVG
ncbi:MAG: secretin and TonB N-terminal domain-containing protein [Candidatus Hydrogenedentota bacterium]